MRLMKKVALGIALASTIGMAGAANAENVISGTMKGVNFEARSTIIGVNSTATIAGGGDARYLAQAAAYRGVVGLLMDYGAAGQFVCSGSLANQGRSIVTAAHCVSGGPGSSAPVSVKAFFYDGNPADAPVYSAGAPGVTVVDISQIFVNPAYTGQVIDQNDIAVLRLASAAPTWANSYDILTSGDLMGGDLTGVEFNVAGLGRRSSGGGNIGANLGTGRLRQGDNRYEFRMGDSDFAPGDWEGGFLGTAAREHTYMSDFDNGLAANDAACNLIGTFWGYGGPKYCNTGLGLDEVGISGGDSGGPGFVNGKLASVNSFGLTFFNYGDVDNVYNSSFGEYSGYVPTYIHGNFFQGAFVPEPATWAMMIFGFGMVGGSMRRRTAGKAVAA